MGVELWDIRVSTPSLTLKGLLAIRLSPQAGLVAGYPPARGRAYFGQ